MPRLKKKKNFFNKNKLLWILSGKVYQAPTNSFLNFYTDHKINKDSFIFRTKIINHYPGSVKILNNKPNLCERSLQISTNQYKLDNSTINRINSNHLVEQYILKCQKNSYSLNLINKNSKLQLNPISSKYFGSLISNNYQTQIGGIPYYDQRTSKKSISSSKLISYYKRSSIEFKESEWDENIFNSSQFNKVPLQLISRSLIWLPEETYKLNCDKNMLLVEHGSFICENFEIIPGLFSKKSGIVIINYKNSLVSEISIKCEILEI